MILVPGSVFWGNYVVWTYFLPCMRMHKLGRKCIKWGIKYSLSTKLYTLKRHFKLKSAWSDFCLYINEKHKTH